jgi:hypothetical protein
MGLNLFREKALVRRICYTCCSIYTCSKTDSNESSTDLENPHLTEQDDNKCLLKGILGSKDMTLIEVKSLFLTLKNSDSLYKGSCPPGSSSRLAAPGTEEEFRALANGF